MLQPIEKMWSKYGVDHLRSKKCRNTGQGQYKMRGVISARFKNTFFFRPTPLGFRQVVQHVQLHVA